ncbi:cytidylate kinase-like family protein [Desulfococcaceae bacterium HSG7]|nr:cytidylate kinase-like family protein [Desulfococcaceae bacterium HSG7]
MPAKQMKDVLYRWKHRTDEYQSVITISSEAGSDGRFIAQQLAKTVRFDLFDSLLINAIAESAEVSAKVVKSVEKSRLTGIEQFVDMLIYDEYLEPSDYLKHLAPILTVIAEHGHAVIVGRGANFIIPKEKKLSVRIIAPMEKRILNITNRFDVSADEAKRRISNRENRRATFVKRSFNANISDPVHYDLVINSGNLSNAQIVNFILSEVNE